MRERWLRAAPLILIAFWALLEVSGPSTLEPSNSLKGLGFLPSEAPNHWDTDQNTGILFQEALAPPTTDTKLSIGDIHLVINRINVDAPLEKKGLT